MTPLHRMSRPYVVLASLLSVVAVQMAQQQGEPANHVTLTKRLDNGAYKTSAWSFRYESQDVAVHRNYVDLVFDACGCVHTAVHGGSKSTIARVEGKKLSEVTTLPRTGWQQCILPEKGAVYVLSIDDQETRMQVKLLVTEVTDKSVKFEWAQLPPQAGQAGTKGQCSGPHEAK